jgi:site-specific DNA-methyltransferase (cytosine-N4-specific)
MKADFITVEKTTAGRGAKPFLVAPTEKTRKNIIEPILKQLAGQTDSRLTALLVKPLSDILKELDSKDPHVSGLALEAMAFKLLRLLGMEYQATRLRAKSTGGSEVDLLFHSARLVYSRWQIQCKNSAHVTLDQVAKEVGLVQMLNSNVIVIISTGKISADARNFANHVMKHTNLCIVFIDGSDINKISARPADIVSVFEREAKATMLLKKLEI